MLERIRQLLIKEFIQIFRDPRMRVVVFLPPIIQMLVFGYAVTTDVKHVATAFYDQDNTPASREFLREFTASGYFTANAVVTTEAEQQNLIDVGEVTAVLRLNRGFEESLRAARPAEAQLILDGSDSNTAAVVIGYARQIIQRYNARRLTECISVLLKTAPARPSVDLRPRVWFNPNLESRNFYVPGVIALIVMLITLLLTSMAIVREKEVGTMEQLIVSPLHSYELIVGKLLPFAIIGLADAVLVASVGILWFRVPIEGSFVLMFGALLSYLLTTLGIGLFISTIAATQQEAMMTTFLFFLPAILLSGFVFPIANMPAVIQYLTYLNPLRYFLVIVRGVFLKGSGLEVLWPQILALLVMGVVILTLSSLRFRKRLG